MRVEAVGSATTSSAGSAMMEMWRMSISQRMNVEMSQRVSGQSPERFKEPRKVEPAVRIEISEQARKLSGS